MLIFTEKISNRLAYSVDFIFKEMLGMDISLTDNQAQYQEHGLDKINYSSSAIEENEFWIKPHHLLFEEKIEPQAIEVFGVNNFKAFYQTKGSYPFDIFAATFYLLSRYEEYLPHKPDHYGRYDVQSSLAYKNNFIKTPLINYWVEDFKQTLLKQFPTLCFGNKQFQKIFTYDIDIAWSYLHKGPIKNTGGILKLLANGQVSEVIARLKILAGRDTDPYDAYEYLDLMHTEHGLSPIYFFLVAEKNSRYDRNILLRKKAMQTLIEQHAAKYTIGLHPSWQSGGHMDILKNELAALTNVAGKIIIRSRQHYIKMQLPHTYRRLIACGITEDYSMGYGLANGFRASVATPFYWFDLEKNEQTALRVFPFCFMDATSFFVQKDTAAQAFEEWQMLHETVRHSGGLFISIWHNQFLGSDPLFDGWKQLHKACVEGD